MTHHLSRFAIHAKCLLLAGLLTGFFSAVAQAEAPQTQETKAATWSEDKRFSDNGDQTITDHKTGLMWMKVDAFQLRGHLLNWMESIAFVDKLNQERFAHYGDWRVPTTKELITLYEADKTNHSADMVMHMDPIFPRDGLSSYWSNETNGQNNAFGVVMNTGGIFNASRLAKSKKTVRAVRNAQ